MPDNQEEPSYRLVAYWNPERGKHEFIMARKNIKGLYDSRRRRFVEFAYEFPPFRRTRRVQMSKEDLAYNSAIKNAIRTVAAMKQ